MFGFLFILAVLVAGVVVHRRWRDAISLVGFGHVLRVALLLFRIGDRRSLVLVVPVVLAWRAEYPDRS